MQLAKKFTLFDDCSLFLEAAYCVCHNQIRINIALQQFSKEIYHVFILDVFNYFYVSLLLVELYNFHFLRLFKDFHDFLLVDDSLGIGH